LNLENQAILVKNLSFSYDEGRLVVFDNISFSVPCGKITYITGPSGCGKSTLLNILTNVSDKDIYYFGKRIDKYTQNELNSFFSIVYQNPETQIFTSTVEDEVAFGPYNLGLEEQQINVAVEKAIEKTDLKKYKNISPDNLSGGQKQLLVIACAIAMDTPVIFLDEPMAWLDEESSEKIMNLLISLKNEGKTIVIIDHNEKRISNSDHLIRLEMSFLRKYHKYESFLSSGYENIFLKSSPNFYEYNKNFFIKTENLEVYFPESDFCLESLNLNLEGGVITSAIGPCGSGKTTLGKLICGLIKPSKGEVRINGEKISGMSLGDIGSHIGYLFQDPGRQIFAPVVLEDLIFPSEINKENILQAKEKAKNILRLLCLLEKKHKSTYTLSMGEKQRVAIAGMLMRNFSYLVLDEPTTGLDSFAKSQVISTLKFLKEKLGIGMFIISHDKEFCEEISDRIIKLEGGKASYE